MAGKKNLSSIAVRNKNIISQSLIQTQKLNQELCEIENTDELSEALKRNLIMLEDENLLDDPDNKEFYGVNEVESLAAVMKEKGFQGVILAYPFENKYRIEAGHRRREAARLAGIKAYPVFVTEAPEHDWERIQRLLMANQNSRASTPMMKAREAEGFFQAFKQESKYKAENGLEADAEPININERIAAHMGMEKSTVELYRRLVKLIPKLQELVETEDYAWSAIATASNLDAERQEDLYRLIVERTEKSGAEAVKRDWISNMVARLKTGETYEQISGTGQVTDTEAKPRKKNCLKIVRKGNDLLKTVLEEDSIVKRKDVDELIEILGNMRESIDRKLVELAEKKSRQRNRK